MFFYTPLYAENPPLTGITTPFTKLNALYDDLQVVLVNNADFGKKADVCKSKKIDIHAGVRETSLMLYLNEELMLENDCVPDYPQSFLNHVPVFKISKTGTWGEPSLATKENGEAIYKIKVDNMVEYVRHVFEISPKEAC